LAREVESIRLELENEERLAFPCPRHAQSWYREEHARVETRRRLRVEGLRDALDKAVERRRLHGWTG
jgi:hypothetical protein